MAEPTYNAGNLEDGGQAGRTGATYGPGGRFPVFDSPQMGVRAMFRDLRTKMNRHKGDVSKIINQYAPRSENPATYEQYVLDQVGSTVTEDNLDDLVRVMIRFENTPKVAKSYLSQPDIIEEAMRLSRIDLPSDASLEDARRMAEPRPRPQLASDIVGLTGVPRNKPRLTVPELEGSEDASLMDFVPDVSSLVSGIRGLLDRGGDSRKLSPTDQEQFSDLMSRLSQQGK